jgi:hypothetical protein
VRQVSERDQNGYYNWSGSTRD